MEEFARGFHTRVNGGEDVRLTIFFVVYKPEKVLVFEELSLFVCC